jgi:uncharacterized protein DUF3551
MDQHANQAGPPARAGGPFVTVSAAWRAPPAARCYAVNAGRATAIPTEVPMRIQALAIFAIGMFSIVPASAQTYDPAYPVCLQAYGPDGNHYDCSYTSLSQCNASASGLSAQCATNPYFVRKQVPTGYRRHR